MTMNLKKMLFKSVAVMAMLAPAAGTTVSSVSANGQANQPKTTKMNHQQKLNSLHKQAAATKAKNYPKYESQLRRAQIKLDDDQNKAGQTGTAGSEMAKSYIPKDKARVNNAKTMLPANMSEKVIREANQKANKQNASTNAMEAKQKKARLAKKNAAKKNSHKLINRPQKPRVHAAQTAKQKAAQKDAKGEAANTTGQKRVPKQRPASFKGNQPKQRKVVKKSLPQTIEQAPKAYVYAGGALLAVVGAGAAYMAHRKHAEN